MITNNGAFIGTTGNLPGSDPIVSHHLTMTGDPAGGLMRVHDTFQVGSQSISFSGPQYNNVAPTPGVFDPSPQAAQAFRQVFGG